MEDLNLRPMTLGEVLDRTFRLYKSNFWLFAGITALPFLLILIFQVIVAAAGNRAAQITQPPTFSASYLAGIVSGVFLLIVLYFLIMGYTQAATIFAVSDLYLGHSVTVRGSFAKVGAKVFRILLIFFILFLLFIVVFLLFALVVGIVSALFKSVLLMGILFFLAITAALIFFCRVALAVPTAMLENLGAVRSIGRSVQLTEGFAMQVFLIYLLVIFLTYAAILIFQLPFMGVATRAAAAHQSLPFGMVVLQDLGSFICQILVGPIGTIATSLMYYNLRVRKEAFDIQHLMSSLQAGPTPGPAATT
jgi:hypothetical protein